MNIISSSSNLIIKPGFNQITWHDLNVNFMMERYIGLPDNNQQSYDDCVLNLNVLKTALIKDYVEPSFGSSLNSSCSFGKLPINTGNIKQIYDVLLHSNDYCANPSETIKNEMIPSMMRAKRNMKFNTEPQDLEYVYTDDLELDKERNKPKIIINIPRFTKIVQVS